MSFEGGIRIGVIVCAIYLCLAYGSYLLLMVSGLYENARRHREHSSVDFDTIAGSRFAPGVSILLAAYNEAATIVPSIHSILALDYPTFEIVVVNDGSTDETLAVLSRAFDLIPVDRATRDALDTEHVRAFYQSPTYPQIVVLDKANGGKADALNAALNIARHPYICGVDADTIFSQDALLKAMRVCIADPLTVVGVTSYIEISADPRVAMATPPGERTISTRPLLVAFQTLDYLRAFFNNRIAWSRNDFMMCAIGAFQIWRRDIVEEHGGWSRNFTCEDIELTFRLHESLRRQKRPYRILCLPDPVGATEGPDTVQKLVSQRERWQRVTLETWWAFRRMCFNPRYGKVGTLGMPFYLVSEIIAPIFELATVVIIGLGVATGLIQWDVMLWTAVLIAMVNGVFNAGAILGVDRQARDYKVSALLALLLIAPLELVVYRPIMSWARLKGTVRFLRGDKDWHKFDRNALPRTS